MRTISLWQPWATAIVIGLKTIETRGWSTEVRGRIAIHATKARSGYLGKGAARVRVDFAERFNFFVSDVGFGVKFAAAGVTDFEDLPFGAIVATVELADCVPVEEMKRRGLAPAQAVWGDYSPGRFAWILRDVRAIPVPIPFHGAQGFFDCSAGGVITPADHAAAAARRQRAAAHQSSLPL